MDFENHPARSIVLILLGIFVLSGIAFGLKVALSEPVGQGEAIIQKNSAENWTGAQARFENLYGDIIESDQKIAIHKAALDADPGNPTLQTNYTGIQSVCNAAVADYNAEARKFLSADFKAADLPDKIDGLDPATDCK